MTGGCWPYRGGRRREGTHDWGTSRPLWGDLSLAPGAYPGVWRHAGVPEEVPGAQNTAKRRLAALGSTGLGIGEKLCPQGQGISTSRVTPVLLPLTVTPPKHTGF